MRLYNTIKKALVVTVFLAASVGSAYITSQILRKEIDKRRQERRYELASVQSPNSEKWREICYAIETKMNSFVEKTTKLEIAVSDFATEVNLLGEAVGRLAEKRGVNTKPISP